MKNYVRLSIFLICIFTLAACYPTQKFTDPSLVITPLSDTISIRDGSIVYGLPRTVFTISVEMEKVLKIPGPYARYATDLLGLKDVIQNESESWSIEGIEVKSNDELDPSEFYVIKSNTLFQSNILALRKEGLILDLNPAIYNSKTIANSNNKNDFNEFHSYDMGSDEYYISQRDTAFKRIKVDSTFIRIPYVVDKKKILTIDQLAEKAAKRLMELRDGKHLILTGEATVFPQNDAALNEINRLEKVYTELFSGKILKETRTFVYQIIPEKTMIGKKTSLFQFSELTGPVASSKKDGVTVSAELIPEGKTKDLTILNRKPPEKGTSDFDKLYYRVPDVVNLKINMGNEILFNSRKLIYQFGEIIKLPANYLIGK